jgi:hypothetical protein
MRNLFYYFLKIRKRSHYIIGLYYDAWRPIAQDLAKKYGKYLDANWITDPNLIDYYSNNKLIIFPYPCGLLRKDLESLSNKFRKEKIGFVGNIEDTNITRLFWYYQLRNKQEIKFDFSTHATDQLNPYDSYLNYLSRLTNYECGLNFTTRIDGSRPLTGRFFELIFTKSLLIQEYTSEGSYYFEPNNHYLEFRNIKELSDIVDGVLNGGIDINLIRKNASEYAIKKYGDDILVKHLNEIIG